MDTQELTSRNLNELIRIYEYKKPINSLFQFISYSGKMLILFIIVACVGEYISSFILHINKLEVYLLTMAILMAVSNIDGEKMNIKLNNAIRFIDNTKFILKKELNEDELISLNKDINSHKTELRI